MHYVYSIGNKEDLQSNDFSRCYIGVTNNTKRRWYYHTRSKYKIGKSINSNNWSYEENFKIIFQGTSEECYQMEIEMRPTEHMGLNEAKGGCGGYTKYSKERNKKISDALKGRIKTIDHITKISNAKKLSGVSAGKNNSKARKWVIIDPNGNETILHGNLFKFCELNGINSAVLRENLGSIIEPPNSKYRDYGKQELRKIRMNTIGWKLIKEK